MIQTYRHFNKANEFLLGLSFKALIHITLIVLPIIWIAFQLKLGLNSPFLLFLGIISMILIAFIIKSSRDTTVQGFYSSFLLHPFENHCYSWQETAEGHEAIESLLDLKEIKEDHLLSKDGDLLTVLKLKTGISFHRYSTEERKTLLEKWGAFLASLSNITNLKSYFWTNSGSGDVIQLFTSIEAYAHPEFVSKDFIPDENFYIVLRERNPENNLPKLLRFFNRHILKKQEVDLSELQARLEQKTQTLINTLKSFELEVDLLEAQCLESFLQKFLPLNSGYKIEDKAKYLEHDTGLEKFLTKTYRLALAPESGELDFWIKNYPKLLKCESTISLQLNSRDAYKDRKEAESKSSIFSQMNKSSSSYKLSVIKESQKIADELVARPYSFDLVLLITVYASSPEELQRIDNRLKQPLKTEELASLERQQMKNWIYSLPLAFNALKKTDRIFCNLAFARACFPFVKSPSGTQSGPLLGENLESKRPVFLDEYDRSLFNNRGINFIGDSGSGKTLCAKLAVKRRLETDPEKKFYIIDNTADGWKFFIEYFAGEIIELDNPRLAANEALFSPLSITPSILSDLQSFNNHIEKVLGIFELIANRGLQNSEKTFLTKLLQDAYAKKLDLKISDLIWRLEALDDERRTLWIELLSPYSFLKNGIYAALMDSSYSEAFSKNLILFTFSKIKTDPVYQNLCLKLFTDFIERRIVFEKQSKTTLILDEAWKIFQNTQAPQGKELLTHLARAGRGLDLGLWTISQKPSDLPGEVHSSASMCLCFQLKEKSDRTDLLRYANLNESEKELLDSYEVKDPGVCLFKTTRSSDLIKITLEPLEAVLCNSTREFSNKRRLEQENWLKQGYKLDLASKKAAELLEGVL